MHAIDSAARSVATPNLRTKPAVATNEQGVLANALGSLGVENYSQWAWENYKRVVRDLCKSLRSHRIIEVGGGRDPLFSCSELAELRVEMTVNDISPTELNVLPAGYRTACFDVAGDISSVDHLRGSLDLAFSRMVFEHVEDGQRAWANLYQLLAPGGVALAFIPTLYSVPFLLNWLLPDKLAAMIVKQFFPNRTDEEDPVFPARYSWCLAGERHMRPMLSAIGYREIAILPFYGHSYYASLPVVRDLHKRFTEVARKMDLSLLASYAYIAVRK